MISEEENIRIILNFVSLSLYNIYYTEILYNKRINSKKKQLVEVE